MIINKLTTSSNEKTPHIHNFNACNPQSADAMHMHIHCLHTQQVMKLHRTPPRATYDAVLLRPRPASGDIHEYCAKQYKAMT
jgi:hypothetical protein